MTWADDNYAHRKQITIDHTKVVSDETDFPVLIKTTDSDLTDCLSNGYDIKFYDSTNSNKLKHEIVYWDNTTGELVAWVKIPSLSSTTDTIIYMYYENPSETTPQEDPTNVWDVNYKAVWHMADSSASVLDSTANNNDLSQSGTLDYQQSGKIKYSINFPGTDDYLYCNDFVKNDDVGTVEAWVYRTSDSARTIFGSQYTSSDSGYFRFLYWPRTTTSTGFYGYNNQYYGTTSGVVLNSWVRVVGGSDGNAYFGKINTTSVSYSQKGGTNGAWFVDENNHSNFNEVTIGVLHRSSGKTEEWIGRIEELRYSNTNRSSSWLDTSYNNQNSPSTFLSFGSEENVPTPPSETREMALDSDQYYQNEVYLYSVNCGNEIYIPTINA